MLIKTETSYSPLLNRAVPKAPLAAEAAPTLGGGDSFTPSLKLPDTLFKGALGAVPLLGAGVNFLSGVQAQFNGNKSDATAAGVGALANLAGTGTLIGGAIAGNGGVIGAGLALLGVAGLATAYALK